KAVAAIYYGAPQFIGSAGQIVWMSLVRECLTDRGSLRFRWRRRIRDLKDSPGKVGTSVLRSVTIDVGYRRDEAGRWSVLVGFVGQGSRVTQEVGVAIKFS